MQHDNATAAPVNACMVACVWRQRGVLGLGACEKNSTKGLSAGVSKKPIPILRRKSCGGKGSAVDAVCKRANIGTESL